MLLNVGSIGSQLVGAVVLFSLLWNFWHTYMQKFGILRLYRAKEPAAVQSKGPAWVDKYFLLCWIPLYFSYLGPKYKDLILANASDLKDSLTVIIAFMQRYESWLVLPSVLIAAGGVCLWLQHEWRANRFRNRARLSAASGTLLISTALFWANPVEAFIAFAFSHAVEYMVFVWAFQQTALLSAAAPAFLDAAAASLSKSLVRDLYRVLRSRRDCPNPVGPGHHERREAGRVLRNDRRDVVLLLRRL